VTVDVIISQIIQNNPTGVYNNLVLRGQMAPGITPSVSQLADVIDAYITANPDQAGEYLVAVLNVPVANGMYYNELTAIQSNHGQSPSQHLAILLSRDNNEVASWVNGSLEKPSWFSIALVVLAVVGAVTVVKWLVNRFS
jgi:hypothetical protein